MKRKANKSFWPVACPICLKLMGQYLFHRSLPPGEWLRCEACMEVDTEVKMGSGGAYKVKERYVAKDGTSTPPVAEVSAKLAARCRYVGAMRVYAETVCYVFIDPETRTYYAQPAG